MDDRRSGGHDAISFHRQRRTVRSGGGTLAGLPVDGHLVPVGYSRTKREPRRYRVDGIQRAESTEESFALPRRVPPPPTDYRPAPDDHRVVFEIQPRGHWVIKHYSMRILSEDPAGVTRAEFYTRDPRVAAQLTLRLGPSMQIVESDEALKELAKLATAVLQRYGEPARRQHQH